MNRRLGVAIALLVGLFGGGPLSLAQEGGACPALVDTALSAVGDHCAGLARNEACYGYQRVDAVFWADPLAFSTPSDRVPLAELHTITTAPLDPERDQWGIAVLSVQANLPDTLPGQNVTFLLMGDATLENAVDPERATPRSARGVASSNGNLRARPTTNSTIVGAVAAGDTLRLVGVNAAGDWYEVELDDGGTAWIWGELVQAGYTYGLAVTEETSAAPRYGVMQAFTLSTGLGGLACNEAPDALLIQNPTGTAINLRINGMEVALGSTAAFSTVALPDGGRVLVGVLIEGEMTARTETFAVHLTGAGDYVAARLDGVGRVDERLELVDLGASGDLIGQVQAVAQAACAHSAASGVLEPVGGDCAIEPKFVPAGTETGSSATESSPSASLSLVNAMDACTVAAINGVNLRSGPGTNYLRQGQLSAGQTAHPDGYVLGVGGFRWWRLEGGAWLRGDLVETAGACDAVAAVTPPEPPSQTAAPSSQGGSLTTFLPITYCSVSAGGVSPWRHPANTPLTLQGARPGASEALVRDSAAYITTNLILDGTSLGEGARFVDMVTCTGPACFRVNWTTPPLAPGQHTAQAIYTLTQRWSWDADPNQYAEAGTVVSDTCVFVTE